MKTLPSLLCAILVLSAIHCSKTEQKKVSPVFISRSLIFLDSRQGSSDTFTVFTEGDWELSTPVTLADFSFSPRSGKGNAVISVKANLANGKNLMIEAPFNISSGNNFAVAKLVQDAYTHDANNVLLGTNGDDFIAQTIQTADGGYLHVGASDRTGPEIPSNAGQSDVLLIKTDASGSIKWTKTFGGSGTDIGYSCLEAGGNIFITGESNSNSNGFDGSKGQTDLLLLKVSQTGDLLWQKRFGGSKSEKGNRVRLAPDNNLLIAGTSDSYDGDIPNFSYIPRAQIEKRMLAIRVNQDGALLNVMPIGGDYGMEANDIQALTGTEFFLAGSALVQGITNLPPHFNTAAALYSFNVNFPNGWVYNVDGYQQEYGKSCVKTPDGGLIVVGHNNGVWYNSGSPSAIKSTGYITKFRSNGTVEWERQVGRYGEDLLLGIQPYGPGKYLICGATSSIFDYVSEQSKPTLDGWIFEINEFGMTQWQEVIGGNGDDYFTSVLPIGNNDFLLTGKSNSTKLQQVNRSASGDNAWIVRLQR